MLFRSTHTTHTHSLQVYACRAGTGVIMDAASRSSAHANVLYRKYDGQRGPAITEPASSGPGADEGVHCEIDPRSRLGARSLSVPMTALGTAALVLGVGDRVSCPPFEHLEQRAANDALHARQPEPRFGEHLVIVRAFSTSRAPPNATESLGDMMRVDDDIAAILDTTEDDDSQSCACSCCSEALDDEWRVVRPVTAEPTPHTLTLDGPPREQVASLSFCMMRDPLRVGQRSEPHSGRRTAASDVTARVTAGTSPTLTDGASEPVDVRVPSVGTRCASHVLIASFGTAQYASQVLQSLHMGGYQDIDVHHAAIVPRVAETPPAAAAAPSAHNDGNATVTDEAPLTVACPDELLRLGAMKAELALCCGAAPVPLDVPLHVLAAAALPGDRPVNRHVARPSIVPRAAALWVEACVRPLRALTCCRTGHSAPRRMPRRHLHDASCHCMRKPQPLSSWELKQWAAGGPPQYVELACGWTATSAVDRAVAGVAAATRVLNDAAAVPLLSPIASCAVEVEGAVAGNSSTGASAATLARGAPPPVLTASSRNPTARGGGEHTRGTCFLARGLSRAAYNVAVAADSAVSHEASRAASAMASEPLTSLLALAWACRRLRVSAARAQNASYLSGVSDLFRQLAPALQERAQAVFSARTTEMEASVRCGGTVLWDGEKRRSECASCRLSQRALLKSTANVLLRMRLKQASLIRALCRLAVHRWLPQLRARACMHVSRNSATWLRRCRSKNPLLLQSRLTRHAACFGGASAGSPSRLAWVAANTRRGTWYRPSQARGCP